MLNSIEFMSLSTVKSLGPSKDIAVISIHDSSSAQDLPSFNGFIAVLRLNMLDVCEEHLGLAPGAWSNEPSLEQHLAYCEIPNNFAPALSHATAIRAYVDELHARAEELHLVVYCSAGVSRSAAVA